MGGALAVGIGGSWRLGGGGGVDVFCVMIPCRMVVAIDTDTDTDTDTDFTRPRRSGYSVGISPQGMMP
ncbi:MAG: hypothetical protein PHC78_08760, partial [Verrucomicrobiota bacterium]|nr:hypothetical protein [Verrucomicrobiota bacterium]